MVNEINCTRSLLFLQYCKYRYFDRTHTPVKDRAEKRLRMRAVDSFWRVFDRLINESLPPWTTLLLLVISWRLPHLTRWNLTKLESNPIQQEPKSLTYRTYLTLHALSRFVHDNKFSRSCTPSKFSKNNFPLLKARPNSYFFTADLVFSL